MNATVLTVPATSRNWKRVGWILLLLGGLFAAGNAVMFMLVDGHGSAMIKDRFFLTAIAGWGHAMGGAVAALIGPFQLITKLRTSWPRVHVWMGRTYLLAALAGGLGGLYFAPMSTAGIVGSLGFTTLPLLIIGGVAFATAYTLVAWISWVPNWLVVEAWLRRAKAVPR